MSFIGISQRLVENTSYLEIREALSLEWGEFFKEYLEGYLPLPLNYKIDFCQYIPFLKAVILSGGNDLDILNPNPLSKMRDCYESEIIRACMQYHIPLLGICRGAQMIASYFHSCLEDIPKHIGEHKIIEMATKRQFCVNSFHNYGIRTLGEDLESLSIAEDKSVESFKHRNLSIYGIMWHIEREGGMNGDNTFYQWRDSFKEGV
ncbi:gamma-glutamyl-CDP-amidate hydrolase [Helicobacter mesocricetorum]|uniref:gamma-glutamyl-CDP-amidate hydrolase n=1 Tax=Helicobacter mesocricetorum TaxID=87012 RepID=UPI000CF171EC|nr:gamma-glutamyl-CDP-amidate hydrolase [Helicobacter mesocricetorum]